MALELRQQLKLSQQLIMTPQLQMAIKLLQLSRLELLDTVTQELEENPALEEITEATEAVSQAEEQAEPEDQPEIKEVTIDEKINEDIDWSNYLEVFRVIPFGRFYWNSVFVASWVTFLQVFTSSLAAFSFARIRWPGRDRVFILYLATMMLPGLVMMIPNYQIMISLRLVDSFAGLINHLTGAQTNINANGGIAGSPSCQGDEQIELTTRSAT